MGDRWKCQTYTASPAEPGGLLVMLGRAGYFSTGERSIRARPHRKFNGRSLRFSPVGCGTALCRAIRQIAKTRKCCAFSAQSCAWNRPQPLDISAAPEAHCAGTGGSACQTPPVPFIIHKLKGDPGKRPMRQAPEPAILPKSPRSYDSRPKSF
jgi:hypothetical protein